MKRLLLASAIAFTSLVGVASSASAQCDYQSTAPYVQPYGTYPGAMPLGGLPVALPPVPVMPPGPQLPYVPPVVPALTASVSGTTLSLTPTLVRTPDFVYQAAMLQGMQSAYAQGQAAAVQMAQVQAAYAAQVHASYYARYASSSCQS